MTICAGYQDFSLLKKHLHRKKFNLFPVSSKINSTSYRGDASAIIPIDLTSSLSPSKERKRQVVNILDFVSRTKSEGFTSMQNAQSRPKLNNLNKELNGEEIAILAAADEDIKYEIQGMNSAETTKSAVRKSTDEKGEIDEQDNFVECFLCNIKVKKSLLQEHVNECLDRQEASDFHPTLTSPSRNSPLNERKHSLSDSQTPSSASDQKRQRSIFDFLGDSNHN